jgi:hypothetical protein
MSVLRENLLNRPEFSTSLTLTNTIQHVPITKVSLLQSDHAYQQQNMPPAATIHTPAEPIHSPVTRSPSAVRKDRAKPRTPCKQSQPGDIRSRRDEGPAPSTARFQRGRSAADLSAFKAALQRVLGSCTVEVYSARSRLLACGMLPGGGSLVEGLLSTREGSKEAN